MEELKITIETKYLDSISKWCVGIWCQDGGYEVWTGGCFHKDRAKAEMEAMASFKKSVAYQRELKKMVEKRELSVSV